MRKTADSFSKMKDMLLCLLVILGMAVYYYGIRAAAVAVVTTAAAVLSDMLCVWVRAACDTDGTQNAKHYPSDISAVVMGLTVSLMLPAAVPYYVGVTAGVFASVIAKHAFGGKGCEIFSGAAAGYLFAELCWPESVLSYTMPFDYPALSSTVSNTLYQSFSGTMLNASSSAVTDFELMLGKFAAPMGGGIIILLAVSAVYLMGKGASSPIVIVSEILTYGLLSFLINSFDISAVKYDIICGMTLFVAVFISSNILYAPENKKARLGYGLLTGVLMFIFRYYARVENPIVYAVIIAAPIGIELDRQMKIREAAVSEKEEVPADEK